MDKQVKEAERIYRALFRAEVPAELERRFDEAGKRLEARYREEDIDVYYRCLERVSDLESLEMAARYRRKLPLLTDKFRVMVYLSETLPGHYSRFINETGGLLKAYLFLGLSAFASAYKLAKGLLILARVRK